MIDRYARYDELREMAVSAEARAEYDFAAALRELAHLVILSREREAAAALLGVSMKVDRVTFR